MFILGIVLIIVGALLGIGLIYLIGAVLAIIGGVLLLADLVFHRPIGGSGRRRLY